MSDAIREPAERGGLAQVGRSEAIVISLLLLALLAALLALAARSSETIDERFHVDYGRRLLRGHPERIAAFDSSKMPVSAGNALPSLIADNLPSGAWKNRFGGLVAARLATIAMAVALAGMVWKWARDLYGPVAGIVSLSLFALDPNLLAHSHLATTDIATALGLFGAAWAAWRGTWRRGSVAAVVEGVWLGFALLAKYFALLIVPLLFAVRGARAWLARRPGALWIEAAPPGGWRRFALILSATLCVIYVGFGFDRAFSPLGSFDFWSRPMQHLAEVPGLGSVPLPLPDSYVVGFDMALDAERETHTYGKVYLFGRLFDEGVPGYYFIAALFKVPLPTLFLGCLFLLRLPRLTTRYKFWNDEVFLAAPLAAFAVYLNFFFNAQIGIRHFLVVFPFAFVLLGGLFRNGWPVRPVRRLGTAILGLWLLASTVASYPYYIPYFNELLVDRKLAYRVLSDSNVDWGQALSELRRYLAANPDVKYAPAEPVSGRVIVGVNSLTGVVAGDRFAWLRPLDPVDHVGYSYLLFEVPESVAEAARRAGSQLAAP